MPATRREPRKAGRKVPWHGLVLVKVAPLGIRRKHQTLTCLTKTYYVDGFTVTLLPPHNETSIVVRLSHPDVRWSWETGNRFGPIMDALEQPAFNLQGEHDRAQNAGTSVNLALAPAC